MTKQESLIRLLPGWPSPSCGRRRRCCRRERRRDATRICQ